MNRAANAFLLALASFSGVAQAQQALPPDVSRFVERRALCDHFRGEEPYDEARRRFLERRLKQHCTGTDAKLTALKRKYKYKYKGRKDVLARLNQYEEDIESK